MTDTDQDVNPRRSVPHRRLAPHTVGPAPVADTSGIDLGAGTAMAVFAEGREPALWRRPIRNPHVAAAARLVVDRARSAAGTPITALTFTDYVRFDVDGDRAAFQTSYLTRRRRLYDAAIAALLTDDAQIGAVEDLIWAVCDEYAWALPAHIRGLTTTAPEVPHDEVVDLYGAETAFALAEITTLLGERLHPLVVARAHRAIERRVLAPFRRHEWWWERIETNWSAVCAAGVGMAAMYLEATGLGAILARCNSAMDSLLAGYGDDGACPEGLSYWTYGFGHFAIYAEALRQRTEIDLWARPKARRIGAFAAEMSLGGRAVAAFSDADPLGSVSPALVALLESRDPALPNTSHALWQTDPIAGTRNWGLPARTFVWARDAEAGGDTAPLPDRWFPDAQWLIARHTADGAEVGFAAKAGCNAEPHNHNDVGSFMVAVGGEPLLSELGAGHYDRDYFDPGTRYDVPAAGSHGHSVPIIASTHQHDGEHARAVVRHVAVEPAAAALTTDLTAAYDVAGLVALTRELRFENGRLHLRDRFTASVPLLFVDRLVSYFPIGLDDDGALIRGEGAALRVRFDQVGWNAAVHELAHRDRHGDLHTVYALDLARTAVEAECVVVAEVT